MRPQSTVKHSYPMKTQNCLTTKIILQALYCWPALSLSSSFVTSLTGRSCFLAILLQNMDKDMHITSLIWFAGSETCQFLGILHWDAADGEAEASSASHVHQVLFCSRIPEWQHISRGALQLWDVTSKCLIFMTWTWNACAFLVFTCTSFHNWNIYWNRKQV